MATSCTALSSSNSLGRHLLRGVVSLVSIIYALRFGSRHSILAIVSVIVAVVALGGCAGCWAANLLFLFRKRTDDITQPPP